MKCFFLTIYTLLPFLALQAQFLDLKGVTVQITQHLYIVDDEPKREPINQVFVVSFADKMLTHLIFTDGDVSDAQLYKIDNYKSYTDENLTILQYDALSGISGNKYRYELRIDDEGRLNSLKIVQPDGTKNIYKGWVATLKTFNQ